MNCNCNNTSHVETYRTVLRDDLKGLEIAHVAIYSMYDVSLYFLMPEINIINVTKRKNP